MVNNNCMFLVWEDTTNKPNIKKRKKTNFSALTTSNFAILLKPEAQLNYCTDKRADLQAIWRTSGSTISASSLACSNPGAAAVFRTGWTRVRKVKQPSFFVWFKFFFFAFCQWNLLWFVAFRRFIYARKIPEHFIAFCLNLWHLSDLNIWLWSHNNSIPVEGTEK